MSSKLFLPSAYSTYPADVRACDSYVLQSRLDISLTPSGDWPFMDTPANDRSFAGSLVDVSAERLGVFVQSCSLEDRYFDIYIRYLDCTYAISAYLLSVFELDPFVIPSLDLDESCSWCRLSFAVIPSEEFYLSFYRRMIVLDQ